MLSTVSLAVITINSSNSNAKFRSSEISALDDHIFRDSPTISSVYVPFPLLLQFYVPFFVKLEKIYNFLCLLEFECAKVKTKGA